MRSVARFLECFHSFLLDVFAFISFSSAPCGITIACLNLMYYNNADVRCWTTYEHVFVRTCQVFLLLLLCELLSCCCSSWSVAACCYCSSSWAGWRNSLLWFIASDSSVLFVFIKTRTILMYRSEVTAWQYCRMCSLDVPIILQHMPYIHENSGHARSLRGQQPAAADPLLYILLYI